LERNLLAAPAIAEHKKVPNCVGTAIHQADADFGCKGSIGLLAALERRQGFREVVGLKTWVKMKCD
jgi:hypothetical protein